MKKIKMLTALFLSVLIALTFTACSLMEKPNSEKKAKQEENIYITIEDNGMGIKKEEIPHLFDRCFRSENVRNKDIDGSGIGLSIAKVLSESLKYKLTVDSEYDKWTKFEIIIPIDID